MASASTTIAPAGGSRRRWCCPASWRAGGRGRAGHGRSDGMASGISYELLVEDVTALIRALDLSRPVLLGHSMGGCTVALLAATHPDLVRAILLEDAVWGDTSHLPQIGESEQYRA